MRNTCTLTDFTIQSIESSHARDFGELSFKNLQQHDSLMQLTVYIKILISKIKAESSPIKSVRTKL